MAERTDPHADTAPAARNRHWAHRRHVGLIHSAAALLVLVSPQALCQVSASLELDLISTTPYVEHVTMTIVNDGGSPTYLGFAGGRAIPPGGGGSQAFACARVEPVDGNLCVVRNECSAFAQPPPLCDAIFPLPPGSVSCTWRVTPRRSGCAAETLEFRVFYQVIGAGAPVEFTLRQLLLGQLPAAAVPIDLRTSLALAAVLLVLGLARLRALRARRRATV